MAITQYRDRNHAGLKLAKLLLEYKNKANTIVLGLPRGGVPVAYVIATKLNLPLDVFLVRKLGVPGHSELAMGAIAAEGEPVVNHELIKLLNISDELIHEVIEHQTAVLKEREHLYRKNKPSLLVAGKTIILVDDGLATGSTMEAAIKALRLLKPKAVVAAVPVASRDSLHRIELLADKTICPIAPDLFYAVSIWYGEFGQTSDDEVVQLLEMASRSHSDVING